MKEKKSVKKKTGTKTTAKKTTSVKKSVSPKTSVKKSPAKKAMTSKKSVVIVTPKEEVKSIEKKESKINNDLLLRAVLTVAYTLIVVILVIGFVEPHVNSLKVDSGYKPAYLVEEKVLDEDRILSLDNAWSKLSTLRGDYFVYVGYTKMYNSDVQLLDRGIANLIDKYDLKNKFYYLNIDSIINKENKVDLEKDTYIDTGSIKVENATLHCWKHGGHGKETFLELYKGAIWL